MTDRWRIWRINGGYDFKRLEHHRNIMPARFTPTEITHKVCIIIFHPAELFF